MKVLFLDVDGVLNDHKQLPSGYCTIHPACMGWLNFIIRHTDCKLVLTSAWRYMILSGDMTLKGFEYMMVTHGLTKQKESLFVGHTVSDEEVSKRENQIFNYIHYHRGMVDKWAIADDLPLEFLLPQYQKRFVKTASHLGLTYDNACDLVSILNGKEYE